MKVLHLFGDWKWTGPAEPTLDLLLELRALGIEADLACPPAPSEPTSNLPAKARERGLEPIHAFELRRSLNPFRNFAELGRLRDFFDARAIDLVHVHFSHDHAIGGLAARRAPRRPRVIRTNHKAVPTSPGPGSRFLLRRLTDGYLTFSRAALDADTAAFGLDGRAWLVPPGLRLERFDPSRRFPNLRPRFGIPPDAFLLGVIARMQRHRRFDVLLEGVRLATARLPDLRVLVVGRGTHMQEVAVEPAKRLGLENVVTFAGYLGEDYLAAVAALDALLFLVPGSDGTCRAIREAMAMAKPVIGARRGMIPELVEDGATGLVIDDTPERIAEAIERLARDREGARALGSRGRERALREFDVRRQARAVLDVYERVLSTAADAASGVSRTL